MDRYLCQLCYTIVTCGEKHPCFFYKNDDEVYILPEPAESHQMDIKHEFMKDSNDDSTEFLPEKQHSDIEIPELISTWTIESNRQISLRDATKTDERFNPSSIKILKEVQQANGSGNLILDTVFNINEYDEHFPKDKTGNQAYSSENIIQDTRRDIVTPHFSKRKSSCSFLRMQSERNKTNFTSFQSPFSDKIEPSHGVSSMFSLKGKPTEGAAKKTHIPSKRFFEAPISFVHLNISPHSNITKENVLQSTEDFSFRDAGSYNGNRMAVLKNCVNEKSFISPNIPVSTAFPETHRKMEHERKNEDIQHESVSEVYISESTANEMAMDAAVFDVDQFAGPSHSGDVAEWEFSIGALICPVCKKGLCSKSKLVTHYRIHSGEKPYSCEVCDYRCNHQSNLKKHLRTHTGEKPFKCSECERCYSDFYGLKRHCRRVHNQNDFMP